MTQQEFIAKLGELLACLPQDQIEESQAFYAEAIADRIEDGMDEAQAVAALGSPEAVAEQILSDLPAIPRAIAKTKRKSTVLLWILTIVGSPLWLSLALAFLGIAFAIYVIIWSLAVCVWAVAIALCSCVPLCLILALDGLFVPNAPFALCMLGIAIALVGGGLLVGAAAWEVTRLIARLSMLWVKKALSPFKKFGSDTVRTCAAKRHATSNDSHRGDDLNSNQSFFGTE